MKTWAVWMEGWAATGQSSPAQFMGRYDGKNFAQACSNWNLDAQHKGKDYGTFDPDTLSVWGCRLFDNERDARKNFG